MCNQQIYCFNCGTSYVDSHPVPFDDEDGRRIVQVNHCRLCGVLDVPDFEPAAKPIPPHPTAIRAA